MQLDNPITTTEAPISRTSEPDARSDAGARGQRLRKRLFWIGGAILLVLLLIFLPPLVNANRYQRQIARSMSASLGRPVHLDNATLHLLPVPGLTLSNFVVSEDPAFGSEPTIRADSVEATLRLRSLWRRPVEFSSIRFIEPHVNLVRNAQGRWNLADVLLHASHVQTAPTVQAHAGPAPRFPYIEATGGRVNLKLGEEKLPFAITDADFALWLPTPNQWRVRLQGQPARTDTNLNDPGTLRVEGDLERAETATGIPVNFHATWHDAPLGEATRLLTGDDLGWRGTVNLDAVLAGTLSQAQMDAKLTLGGLRRAEFAALQPLDLQITCGAGLEAGAAMLKQLHCAMPDSARTPMGLQAEAVDLTRLRQAPVEITAEDIPLHWGLLWAALFSPRIPTDRHPEGRLQVHLQHLAVEAVPMLPQQSRRRRGMRVAVRGTATGAAQGPWTGEIRVELPRAPGTSPDGTDGHARGDGAAYPTELVWHPVVTSLVTSPRGNGPAVSKLGEGLGFALPPTSIPLGAGNAVTLTATVTPEGYTVAINGGADAAALLLPTRYLPQLGDGLEDVLPAAPNGANGVSGSSGANGFEAARVDFTCNHPWGALQTCTNLRSSGTGKRSPQGASAVLLPNHSRVTTPSVLPPVLLAPQSLSPYDRNPPLGSQPGMSTTSPHL